MTDNRNELTSTRPYLLRAMHEWMTDNGQTPLILVDALHAGVQVPEDFVADNQIVLNISWSATRDLQLDNDAVSFAARFSGVPHQVYVPVAAIRGVYARESGRGMMFQEEPAGLHHAAPEGDGESGTTKDAAVKPAGRGRPELRVIK